MQAIDAQNNGTNQNFVIFGNDTTDPTITTTSLNNTINDTQTALGSVSADETVTWTITAGGPGVTITQDPVTGIGIVALSSPADYQTASSHPFTVTATDITGNTSSITWTVTVIDTTPPNLSLIHI